MRDENDKQNKEFVTRKRRAFRPHGGGGIDENFLLFPPRQCVLKRGKYSAKSVASRLRVFNRIASLMSA